MPREVKQDEYRVAITPAGVRELTLRGHTVLVEAGAGAGSSIPDGEYEAAGARIVASAEDVWGSADMVLKVKEPVEEEYGYLREGLVLFTFLHLAALPGLTRVLAEKRVTALGYETVELDDGRLPLLAPMSEVAGRMAPHVAAGLLEKERGGRGILLGGASGVKPARVVVLGAGTAGSNAVWISQGMEAEVILLDVNIERLRWVDSIHKGRVVTVYSSSLAIEELVPTADVVIGAVLVPGARAPVLVSEEIVKAMRPGSVIIDISIDQGGCVATSRMTTHSNPTYVQHGVVHYAVGNMPGAVPHTSTYALTNATLPYVVALAGGPEEAVRNSRALARGVNLWKGVLVNPRVAEAHGLQATPLEEALRAA